MGLIFRLVELLVVLVPLVGAAYATYRGIAAARRQHDPELPVAAPARPASAAQRRTVLRTIEQHDRTDTRWLEYELDAAKVLDYPLMTDLRDPLTERFHRAKLRADFLRPADVLDLLEDRDALRSYVDAVGEYATAFDIAEGEARRRKRAAFTTEEQDRLTRAQRLLRVAADTAATPQERERAYRLAQRELDGLLVLPERARNALERGIGGELGD
ncbi:ATP-dependent DNA helicase RecQ [Mycolicibacterium sp. 018/SC-01/001]|uniref:ATP-dependent DNA helicase RecQ n=1 Tax=Mycolicibacterium sp. 018/SC-01/001 TaxID=2592069 RepID=UPI0011810775|nr:ATP-dependent DNA helicase RecQ [Mycolicibacterium sp. 018/SC-01/001]TRW89007.1 ATP-dependent DNA helicase RecQ [Mycolicibacterium sp. 018/SC-01/001]